MRSGREKRWEMLPGKVLISSRKYKKKACLDDRYLQYDKNIPPAPQEEDRTANQRSGSKITVVNTIAGHLHCMTLNSTMKYFRLNLSSSFKCLKPKCVS